MLLQVSFTLQLEFVFYFYTVRMLVSLFLHEFYYYLLVCYDVSPLALLRFIQEHQLQCSGSNLPMSRLGGFSGQVILPWILHKVKQC
jgi:hypothetical protein